MARMNSATARKIHLQYKNIYQYSQKLLWMKISANFTVRLLSAKVLSAIFVQHGRVERVGRASAKVLFANALLRSICESFHLRSIQYYVCSPHITTSVSVNTASRDSVCQIACVSHVECNLLTHLKVTSIHVHS